MKHYYDIDKVMKYFYEISKIPRKSGNEEKIAEYIENFAKNRNLIYSRDNINNVVIKKQANNKENEESIILQCHIDMVCEKEKNSNHDIEHLSVGL